ncbi:MAG: hypothetical protein Q9197_000909 [Variospora fuerteventurae]
MSEPDIDPEDWARFIIPWVPPPPGPKFVFKQLYDDEEMSEREVGTGSSSHGHSEQPSARDSPSVKKRKRDHPSRISDAMHEDEGGNNNVCSNDDGDGSSDGDDNDEDERRVKEIVGKRFIPRKRRIEYHVLWHGSAGDMTSEPIEHLENYKKMLKEYHDSERGKKSSRGRPNKRAKK